MFLVFSLNSFTFLPDQKYIFNGSELSPSGRSKHHVKVNIPSSKEIYPFHGYKQKLTRVALPISLTRSWGGFGMHATSTPAPTPTRTPSSTPNLSYSPNKVEDIGYRLGVARAPALMNPQSLPSLSSGWKFELFLMFRSWKIQIWLYTKLITVVHPTEVRYIVYQILLQGIYESKSELLVTVALFQLVLYEFVILYMSVCLSRNVFICLWLNQTQFPTPPPLPGTRHHPVGVPL